MATLYVTEFSYRLNPIVPVAKTPPVAEQTVTYTTTAQSAAFNDATTVVRVVADADAFLAWGANPTATAGSMKLPSGSVEYFEVTPGQKVAAYDGSS